MAIGVRVLHPQRGTTIATARSVLSIQVWVIMGIGHLGPILGQPDLGAQPFKFSNDPTNRLEQIRSICSGEGCE